MNNSWNNPHLQQPGQVGQVKLFDPTQFQTPASSVPDPTISKQPQGQAHFQQTPLQNDGGTGGQGAPAVQAAHASWASWGSWDDWNSAEANAVVSHNQQQQPSQPHSQQQYFNPSQGQAVAPQYQPQTSDGNTNVSYAGGHYNWDTSWDSMRMYAQPNQMYPNQSNAPQPDQAYYGQPYSQASFQSAGNPQGDQIGGQQQDPNSGQFLNQGQPQGYVDHGPSKEGQSFTDGGQSQVYYDQPSIPHEGYDPSSFVDSGPWLGNVMDPAQSQQNVAGGAENSNSVTDNISVSEASNVQYQEVPSADPTEGSSSSTYPSSTGLGYGASTSQNVPPNVVAPSLDVYSDNDGDGTVAGFFGRRDDDGDVSSDSLRPLRMGPPSEPHSQGNLLSIDKSFARTNSEVSNASLSTFNMSATEDDGREHLQNLQELVQRMENVDLANRNAEVHEEGAALPPMNSQEPSGFTLTQPSNLPLDTELRSASPDLGLPESAESGGSGASGGSSGLTDWEIVPSQSQMTHSRSNSLDNNVNVYSSQSDNQIDGPVGDIKDGGMDRSIPQSSGASSESTSASHIFPPTTQELSPSPVKLPSQSSASLVNPPPTSSAFSSMAPPPSKTMGSGVSEGGENPFRRGGPSQGPAHPQPSSSGAPHAVPVLSKASRSESNSSSDSVKPKSLSVLPSKPKLSSDDGAPPTREASNVKSSETSSDAAKKNSRSSDDVSLSSQRRHHSAFHPVHRARQNTVSPATTLWENSDSTSSSNILLAPAMPLIIPALNPYSSSAAATATTDVVTNADLKKTTSSSSLPDKGRARKDYDDQIRGRYAERKGDKDKVSERPREREDANRSFDSLDELDAVVDNRDKSFKGGREPRSARDERPSSRSEYPPNGRGDRSYDRPSSRNDRPSSRNDSYRDEGQRRYRNYYRDYGNSYYDERYDRPRSRQDETRGAGSRPSSRSGQEPERPRSRSEYEREADYYYRDRNRGYYDSYGRHPDYYAEDRDRYHRYYREKDSRYSRGYYEEYYGAKHAEYYQQQQQQQQQQQPQSNREHGSRPSSRSQEGSGSRSHSQSRGNTPGVEQRSQGDYYGRGSRPPSRADYGRDYYSRGYAYDAYGGYYDGYGYDPYYGYGAYPGYEDSFNQAYDQGRMTPPKYSYPHVRACFGANGQLVKVLPNRPADGQPALVELQDVQSILESCQETEELQQFPGPLTRMSTHKKDVLYFCQQKARACMEDVYMVNRESAQLIWKLLELLIKQNGVVVGTDLSELLLEGHEPEPFQYSLTADRYSQNAEGQEMATEDSLEGDGSSRGSPAVKTTTDRTIITPSRQREDWIARFRHLLLYGRKKDALECAMKNNLWGHALFLASKMDTRTHASVMTRFANSAMKMNDPLQTLYQLMSGRQPASVTGVMHERWGDWRPHLAMILSNQSSRHELDRKSITTLGDTLASKGYLHASHFCYLMAQVSFGSYQKKTSKIVLIGANHYLPLEEFASSEVIQCTEVYEYAQSLNNPSFSLIHFQTFKYLYACKLVDHGMVVEALMYCEVIANTICQYPTYFQPSFIRLVEELSAKLKYADPHRQHTSEDAEDPMWMQQLHNVIVAYDNGTLQPASGSLTPALNSAASQNSNDSREMTPYQPGEAAQYGAGEGQVTGVSSYESTGFDAAYNQQYHQQQVQTDYQTNAYQQGDAGEGTGEQAYTGTEAYQPQQQQQQQYLDNSQQATQSQQQLQYQQQQAEYNQWQQQQQQHQQHQQPQAQGNYPYQTAYGTEMQQQASHGHDTQVAHHQHHHHPLYPSEAPPAASAFSQPSATTSGVTGVQETGHPPDLTSSQTSSAFSYSAAGMGGGNFESQASISTNETEEDEVDGEEDEVDGRPITSFDYFGNSIAQKVVAPPHRYRTASTSSGGSTRRRRTTSGSSTGSVKASPHKTASAKQSAPKPSIGPQRDAQAAAKGNGGWFGGLFSKFGRKEKGEMILPDDKEPSIVWDPVKEKWIDSNEPEKEEVAAGPPPKDTDLMGKPPAPSTSAPAPAPPAMGAGGANRFSLKAKAGARNQYVDVNNPKPVSVPQNLFNVMPTTTSSAAMPQVLLPGGAGGGVSQNQISEKPATATSESSEGMLNVPTTSNDLSRSSSLSSVNQEVQRITGQTSQNPDPSQQQQQQTGPPAMPVLFNPASLGKSSAGGATASAGPGLKYGQRRAYPK